MCVNRESTAVAFVFTHAQCRPRTGRGPGLVCGASAAERGSHCCRDPSLFLRCSCQFCAPRRNTSHPGDAMTETTLRRPVALIGCNDEWMGRSLESVFAEKGYNVTRTGSGKQALKLARRGGYDVLM